jgi:hypothetical protein
LFGDFSRVLFVLIGKFDWGIFVELKRGGVGEKKGEEKG